MYLSVVPSMATDATEGDDVISLGYDEKELDVLDSWIVILAFARLLLIKLKGLLELYMCKIFTGAAVPIPILPAL